MTSVYVYSGLYFCSGAGPGVVVLGRVVKAENDEEARHR